MRTKKSSRELLIEKCAKEFKSFCARLPWGSRQQMIDMACEICGRSEILTVIRDTEFEDEITAALLERENTLDYLYNRYLELGGLNVTEQIIEDIENILREGD